MFHIIPPIGVCLIIPPTDVILIIPQTRVFHMILPTHHCPSSSHQPTRVFHIILPTHHRPSSSHQSVCSTSDGLAGVVSEVKTLLADSATIRAVKDAGLLLFSYGTTNDGVDAAHFQQYHGVDGIIVDDVAGMANHVLNVTPEDLQPPFGKYGV
ncbi:unnamed protein product [Closterium sp. Yama58-4]|nr:unnamed protein product [Closterium sp. Yama58-4]